MIENHAPCVIQTYLAWLSDSDFDPICKICSKGLKGQDCVRFPCLHVIHTDCCDRHYTQFPKNTAPAGFKCVYCDDKIFPQLNQLGPIADQLREKLKNFSWARTGLGLPILPEKTLEPVKSKIQNTAVSPEPAYFPGAPENHEVESHSRMNPNHVVTQRKNTTQVEIPPENESTISDHRENSERKPFKRTPDMDFAAFKYRRQGPINKMKRLLLNWQHSRKYDEPLLGSSGLTYAIVVIIAIFLLFIWFSTQVSHARETNTDPFLDLKFNPNVHNADVHVQTAFKIDSKR